MDDLAFLHVFKKSFKENNTVDKALSPSLYFNSLQHCIIWYLLFVQLSM